MQGKIVKAVAGFYYVFVAGSGLYECKARGIFRRDNQKPLVGDDVEIEPVRDTEKELTGNVVSLLPRRNKLLRPPVANVEQVLILFAMRTPDPNLLLLDRFLIEAGRQEIPCIIAFNKCEVEGPVSAGEIRRIYGQCGSPLHFLSVRTGEGLRELEGMLRGKTTALAGPSGVGKSSLTNAVKGSEYMAVGEISRKLSRGRNTTRHSELVYCGEETYLCDTPGFTALDTVGVSRENLENYYHEFAPYVGGCYYQGCAHLSEPDCRVKEAVSGGCIPKERYAHYRYLYEELKEAERRRYK